MRDISDTNSNPITAWVGKQIERGFKGFELYARDAAAATLVDDREREHAGEREQVFLARAERGEHARGVAARTAHLAVGIEPTVEQHGHALGRRQQLALDALAQEGPPDPAGPAGARDAQVARGRARRERRDRARVERRVGRRGRREAHGDDRHGDQRSGMAGSPSRAVPSHASRRSGDASAPCKLSLTQLGGDTTAAQQGTASGHFEPCRAGCRGSVRWLCCRYAQSVKRERYTD